MIKPLELVDISFLILSEASKRNIMLRILGGIGVYIHCPTYRWMFFAHKRNPKDVDFASYRNEAERVHNFLISLGYKEDKTVRLYSGGDRQRFFVPNTCYHLDIFFDKLKFCHDIDLKGRLHLDFPTIPLSDLLLEKLQIVEINEKDIVDIILLVREHEIADFEGKEVINIDYISYLCSNDWGLYKTATSNLITVKNNLNTYLKSPSDITDVQNKIDRMLLGINQRQKSLKWKLRSLLGERIKWYREVEEIAR
jgi:hypothetical protein